MWAETSIRKRLKNRHSRPSPFHLHTSASCEERQDTEAGSYDGNHRAEGDRDLAVAVDTQSKKKAPNPLRKSYACFLIISVVITGILYYGWYVEPVSPLIPSDLAPAAATKHIPVDVRCRRAELDEVSLADATTSTVSHLLPIITVIVPVYEGSKFIGQMMDTLVNQTYPCLEVLVTMEPSDDAKQTQGILKTYQSHHPELRMKFYQQKHRLQFAGIMNWLYSRVEGEYYSYMQCDDTLPSNYYQVLAQCLNDKPRAVNCYPRVILKSITGETLTTEQQESAVGPQHERVEKVISVNHWIPFRGVVRRPQYGTFVDGSMERFSQPRLHKIFTSSDHVVTLKQAIAGELIEVNVPYYKLVRPESISSSQRLNKTVLSIADYELGELDHYTRKCNLAYSFAASSDNLVSLCLSRMINQMRGFLIHDRAVNPESVQQSVTLAGNAFLNRMFEVKRVAILGGGIQGCLMALMFRKHGYDVTLIDKANDIMNRASIAGESRIHLGLEYSNDPTMRTASFMLESALRFSSYIEYLVGEKIDWSSLKSERLTCLVAKDSLVSPSEFEVYADKLGDMYEKLLSKEPELSYLGEQPPKILGSKTNVPPVVNASMIDAAYESIEVCILSRKLKEIIRVALHEKGVNIVLGRTILDVKRNGEDDGDEFGGLRVISNVGEHNYDAVVNCLWEGHAGIDQKMGLNNKAENESYRVKASIRLPNHESLEEISSISIMNGPFGDFVRYGPDDKLYFAWHPASPKIITKNISDLSQLVKKRMIDNHRKAFQTIFPGIGDMSVFDSAVLGAGYVVANGETDIAYKDSGLHERRDPPNLISDGYVSVKTQKLTNAPFNVYQLEQELFLKDSLVSKKRGGRSINNEPVARKGGQLTGSIFGRAAGSRLKA